MKKHILIVIIPCLLAFSPLTGHQEKTEEKQDPMKNYSIVQEIQPV